MNARPIQFVGGWTAECEDGALPFAVTGTTTILRNAPGEFRCQTSYSAHGVFFPTRAECQQWISGGKPSTQAPSPIAAVWGATQEQAVALFTEELLERP